MKEIIEVNGQEFILERKYNGIYFLKTPFRATNHPEVVDAIDNAYNLEELLNKNNGTSILIFKPKIRKIEFETVATVIQGIIEKSQQQ